MSTRAGSMCHPANGFEVPVYEGFSWPCLLVGIFWYISKGMWAMACISAVIAICTGGLAWLVFPFFANKQYTEFLLKQGYIRKKK